MTFGAAQMEREQEARFAQIENRHAIKPNEEYIRHDCVYYYYYYYLRLANAGRKYLLSNAEPGPGELPMYFVRECACAQRLVTSLRTKFR